MAEARRLQQSLRQMSDRQTVEELRAQSPSQWEQLGSDSLKQHLIAQASVAHARFNPLTGSNLDLFLADRKSVRYPVRLAFEIGEMALHQFAQPGQDFRDPTGIGQVIYVRPSLREDPARLALAVSFVIPQVNFGAVATDEHCIAYGATLLGMLEDEYYKALCELADSVGAPAHWLNTPVCG